MSDSLDRLPAVLRASDVIGRREAPGSGGAEPLSPGAIAVTARVARESDMLGSMTSEPDMPALGRSLIDTFGRGWAKPDIDLLASVFAPEVVFVETPFSEPVRGLEAVRRWWLDVPYSQSEIAFTSGEIYAAGPWFSTEFKCVFRRKRTGEWVDARGAIFCETGAGLITEMRMYWHRWNGGRETSKP